MLASLSRKLLPHLIEAEDNEIEIMCEFPGETLEILELFVSGKQFLNDLALSNDVAQICENFGIDLDQKCEVVIKEDLGNVFLDNDEPKQEDDTVMFDDDEPKKLYWNSNKGQFQKGPGGRPVKRKRGRPKTKPPAPVVKRPRGRPFKKSKAKPKPAKKVRRKKKNGSDDESDDDEYMPYANMLHKQRVDPGIRQSVDGNKDPLFGFENDDIFQTDENVPKKRQRRQIDLDHIKVEGFIRYPDELSIAFDDHCVWATKVQAIKAYQEKYRKFVRMGYLPKVNPDELRNFQLPQPIESYLRKADFSSQTLNRNAEGKIKCVLCDAFCRTETMLINHQRKFHSEKYVCPTCQRDFEKNQWYQLIRHIYEHSISKGEPLDHECIACGYTASVSLISNVRPIRAISQFYKQNKNIKYDSCINS